MSEELFRNILLQMDEAERKATLAALNALGADKDIMAPRLFAIEDPLKMREALKQMVQPTGESPLEFPAMQRDILSGATQTYAAPGDVLQGPQMPVGDPSVDYTRGIGDVVSTPRASLIRAGLAAEPSLQGKLEIIRNNGLVPSFGPAGQLMIEDPNDPETRVMIDATKPEFQDLVEMGPEMLRLGVEILSDARLAKNGTTLPIPKGASPSLTGLKSFAGRTAVAGLAGVAGGSILEAISAAAGSRDNLSTAENASLLLRRVLGEGAANALGFGAVEGLGRASRGAAQKILHRGRDRTPADVVKTKAGQLLEREGLPGQEILGARSGFLTRLGSASPRFQQQRVRLQTALDDAVNAIWNRLDEPSRNPILQRPIDAIERQMEGASPVVGQTLDLATKNGERALTRAEAGQITPKALDEFTEAMHTKIDALYAPIDQVAGEMRGEVPSTALQIDNALMLLEGNNTPLAKHIRNILAPRIRPPSAKHVTIRSGMTSSETPTGVTAESLLTGIKRAAPKPQPMKRTVLAAGEPIIPGADPIFGKPIRDTFSYNELKQIGTDLGQKINWQKVWEGQEDAVAMEIYHALRTDRFNIASAADPSLVPIIKKANAEYGEIREFLKSPLIANIKRTTEPSRMLSSVMRSPENIAQMKRVVMDPIERRDIAAAYTRDILGINDGVPMGMLNVAKARRRIARMKQDGTWQAIYNDTDGIYSADRGQQVEGLVEALGVEQKRFTAREKFMEAAYGDLRPSQAEAAKNVGNLRGRLQATIRNNPDALSEREVAQINSVLDDIAVQGHIQEQRQTLAKTMRGSRDREVSTQISIEPRNFLEAVTTFKNSLDAEELRALDIAAIGSKEAVDPVFIFTKFMSPEELNMFHRAETLAQAGRQVDELTGQRDIVAEVLETGTTSQLNVPVGGMQWAAFWARVRRTLFARPAGRIIAPESFKSMPTIVEQIPGIGRILGPVLNTPSGQGRLSNSLTRAMAGTLRNPESRQFEFMMRELMRLSTGDTNLTPNPNEAQPRPSNQQIYLQP